MKKSVITTIILMVTGVIILGTQGCQKYPDGPAISFKSRTDRISSEWSIDNYKVNGTDYTSLVTGYSETFTKGGTYSYNWGILTGSGTWKFQNNDKEVRITGINNQSDVTLVILKLEQNQFWYYIMDGDDKKEFHMIQK